MIKWMIRSLLPYLIDNTIQYDLRDLGERHPCGISFRHVHFGAWMKFKEWYRRKRLYIRVKIFHNATHEELIVYALGTPEGRAAFASNMVEPIRRQLDYQALARRIMPIDPLPEGCLANYSFNAARREVINSLGVPENIIRTPLPSPTSLAFENRTFDTSAPHVLDFQIREIRENADGVPEINAIPIDRRNPRPMGRSRIQNTEGVETGTRIEYEDGSVMEISVPEYIGRIPVQQDITVIPPYPPPRMRSLAEEGIVARSFPIFTNDPISQLGREADKNVFETITNATINVSKNSFE